jgi:alkylation response protein AidB-like acyl-CoA dehydrogenase
MNFSLTSEHEMIRKMARDFAEKVADPQAAETDRTHKFPMALFKQMSDAGFAGVTFPEAYGGSDGDDISKVLIVEEIAKRDASAAGTLSINQVGPSCIYKFGTEEQKQKFLPPVLKGGNLAAFALTEPNAGSDAAAAKTKAIADGDYYVIDGSKCFITGGALAAHVVLFALTQPEKGIKGMSAIVVEKGAPGFKAGKIEEKMGLCGSETAELIFDNCRVPKANLLGKEGEGFKIAMSALDGARIGVAAQCLGIAERALEESVKYMKARVQFGKPIGAQQGLSWYVAEMKVRIEATRNLTLKAAYLKSAGQPFGMDAAIAKLYASETAVFCANLGLQIHGGYGYMKEYPMERLYRDAKLMEIYEGTSEIHKLVIARGVLGM